MCHSSEGDFWRICTEISPRTEREEENTPGMPEWINEEEKYLYVSSSERVRAPPAQDLSFGSGEN